MPYHDPHNTPEGGVIREEPHKGERAEIERLTERADVFDSFIQDLMERMKKVEDRLVEMTPAKPEVEYEAIELTEGEQQTYDDMTKKEQKKFDDMSPEDQKDALKK